MKINALIFSFLVLGILTSGCGKSSEGLDQIINANNPNISGQNQPALALTHVASFEGKAEILTISDIVEKEKFYVEKQKMASELHQLESDIQTISQKIEAIKSANPGIFGTIVKKIQDVLGIEKSEELTTLESEKEKLVKSYEEKSKAFAAFKEKHVASLMSTLKLSIYQNDETKAFHGTLTLVDHEQEHIISVDDMIYDSQSEALSFSFVYNNKDNKRYSFKSDEDQKSQDILKDQSVIEITLRGDVEVSDKNSMELLNVGQFSLSRKIPLVP
ncbi:MAG: hypothetical protein A2Z91_00265 [Deltaproteobacteria bacterium GWA2_38_16]|nr:MAG: hypothetical protein A2Z91_00265 [Deltaproteobacteria bacterium GWA2_38_16]OGQ03538.1 MAG: hypothetical protein A3D19_01670 [Deltaproteobacteria bacterium RIFCSPHIGHO2_02_FULL_38_15]OGQ34603.1 MAG: hypothetical protein A3A72_07170 [Deltaproteobacteria bacterium RIFCSPLOWO2_01_FULL_38_9]OGQ59489.1 MAG: hypothetical protein A3G92_02630 [Deltaproteobacteria bacterium RIFCSPLOWO2_12_FULL_38_8]HBQ21222.1 hypothetical protein [Deltaproteobacteria bacterium]